MLFFFLLLFQFKLTPGFCFPFLSAYNLPVSLHPVSYTHLDVYKRQMVDDVIWDGLEQDEMEAFCAVMEKICENLEQCDFKFDEKET